MKTKKVFGIAEKLEIVQTRQQGLSTELSVKISQIELDRTFHFPGNSQGKRNGDVIDEDFTTLNKLARQKAGAGYTEPRTIAKDHYHVDWRP